MVTLQSPAASRKYAASLRIVTHASHGAASPCQNAWGNGMRKIDILVTSEIEGGLAPFEHGDLQLVFHRLNRLSELPLLEGSTWAFVDWMLPETSGLEICRQIRCAPQTAHAHITVILDEDDNEIRRRALRAGADDYLVGPANRSKLLDRVMSVSSNVYDAGAIRSITLGDLTVDFAAFRCSWRGTAIPMMPNEFRLMRFFAEHPGRVFTRTQLIAALGKQDPPVDERTVDVWIGRLRRALRAAGAGDLLRTVRSLGYVFDRP